VLHAFIGSDKTSMEKNWYFLKSRSIDVPKQTRPLGWRQFGNGKQTQNETVQVAVELAYEGDTLLRLQNMLQDTSTPAVVILRNAVIAFSVIFVVLTKSSHGLTLKLL
jgi:hypothetical protein